jgi:hypothetical protein
MLFQHAIPSPLEITKAATNSLPLETRALPNSGGLNTAAMAHAIRHVGLEPYNVNVSHDVGPQQKAAFYAYLRGRIPIIFCILLFHDAPGAPKYLGHHAVAVTGYSLAGAAPVPVVPTGFLLRATRMEKIYVHDDGVGPFARMEYDGKTLAVGGTDRMSLSTGWIHGGTVGSVRAIPQILIVPLYHKIRITFAELHDTVFAFDTFVQALRTNVPLSYGERLEWDIYLTRSGDIKSEFFKNPAKTGPSVSTFLVKSLPRYIWRATGRIGDRVIMDLIFDATDIQHGNYFVDAIEVEPEMRSLIEDAANLPAVEAQHSTKLEWKVIRGFKKK